MGVRADNVERSEREKDDGGVHHKKLAVVQGAVLEASFLSRRRDIIRTALHAYDHHEFHRRRRNSLLMAMDG